MKLYIILLSALYFTPIISQGEDALSLKIWSHKTKLVLYEPLVINVELANTTDSEREAVQALGLDYAVYLYQVSEDGSHFRNIGPRAFLDWEPPMKPLRAGASIRHEQIILYDGETGGLVFPSPKKYYIMVSGNNLESNIIEIYVEPPTEKDINSLSYRMMQNKKVLQHLQKPLPEGMVSEIKTNLYDCAFEEGPYSFYFACIMAERIVENANSSLEERLKAEKMLERADVKGFPLQSKSVYLLGKLFSTMNENEKAERENNRLKTEFAESFSSWRYSEIKERQR